VLTLPDHFRVLLKRIEPDDERTEAAKNIPAQVRDFLQKDKAITTVEPHSRLAGSYARHTAIKDIKDVDIILLIAPDYREQDPGDVLETLFKALYGLPEALDDSGEVVIRRHQRRSVNVHLEKSAFDLDIVPAVALDGLNEPLDIPDKDWSRWVKTHTLGYAESLSELNSDNGDKVVRLVKLLKHWRDVHMVYRRPKSYWLECMVYHRIADGTISTKGISYAELFRDLLSSIYDDFLPYLRRDEAVPQIKDPMLGNNVAHNWERNAFESFMRRVEESHRWAERALEQDDESEAEAAELWQKVFGEEWFPLNVDQEKAKHLSAATLAGNIFVTPTGRVLTERPSSSHVQPSPQRFYGRD
jgi:hypothetical protein